MTGDVEILAEQYDSARRWVDFAARAAASGRHPRRVERSIEPAPHERYLWDTGWPYGEWLEAGETLDQAVAKARRPTPARWPPPTCTGRRPSWPRSPGCSAGPTTPPAAELADRVADAWRTSSRRRRAHHPDTQATARALAFGLVPGELRAASAARLVELVREAGDHLTTGFLATPFLLPVLADTGHLDVAYDVLFQDTEPSWLVMVDRGATTVWEEWGGVDADGNPHASLNHYSEAVISFLHRYVAGLRPVEPGYRRFLVQPCPGGGITSARTHHDSPHGRIAVAWRDEAGG